MTKKIRVLQVLPELNSGGVERGTLEIANALVKASCDALVCSNGGKLESDLAKLGVKHIKLSVHSKNPFRIIANAFKLKQVINEHGVNIIHARSRAPAWSSWLACILTKCNFVTTFHGAYNTSYPFKRLYNSIMLRGDRVIAVSNFILKHIEVRYHIKSNHIRVIHRGVDLKYFNPKAVTEARVKELRKQFNIKSDKKVILLPARFTRLKGHIFLLNALRYMKKQDFICLMIGAKSDAHYEYICDIEKTIREFGLSEKVYIYDAISDMPALYKISDIVISTSIEPEAFGRTIIEAQAMGKVVIATAIGASLELIKNKVNGFLVNPSNPTQLAEVFTEIFKMNSKDINKIINEAQKNVKENFSLDKMCNETIKVYAELLQEKSNTI